MSENAIMILDHVGIVVRDLSKGGVNHLAALPIEAWTRTFNDELLGVSVAFARDRSGVVFELIAPLGENSPVANIVKNRNGVINQLAYRVDDLALATQFMRRAGAVPTGKPRPALAFRGALVQFFLAPAGYIVELIEAAEFEHDFVRSEYAAD